MSLRNLIIGLLISLSFAVNSLAQVTLVPRASFLGTESYERVGYHIHSAGDVNRDGYDDFLIGTFHNSKRGHNAGAAYLILGRPAADWKLRVSLNSANARFQGSQAYDAVGYCVGGAGDLNGDGYDDILIGAPAGDDTVEENPGHLYVIFGKSNPDYGFNFIAPTSANVSFDGENRHDLAGLSAAFIGDINQDGFDDIITSAPYNDYGAIDAGKVYLILGKASGWYRGINLRNAAASFYSTSTNGLFGYSVDGIGDVNGDGVVDFAIGERGKGKVYIFFGRKSVDWGFNCHANNANVIISSEQYGDWAGWRVSRAGDVNGNGIDDLLVAAPMHDHDGQDRGKVYVIFGRSSGWPSNFANADASFIGEGANDQAGWDVQDAGDVNRDGYDDFLIGAWYNDSNGYDSGEIYLIKGKPGGWYRNTSLSGVGDHFAGEHAGDYAGFSVATPGDVNGDGWNDIVASETYNSEAYYWGGKILVFVSDGPPAPEPELSVNPDHLDFGTDMTTLSIYIKNSGNATMSWTAAEEPESEWISSVTPASGSLQENQEVELTVTVDRHGLTVGDYAGTIHISSNGGAKDVGIDMSVSGTIPMAISDLSVMKKTATSLQLEWGAIGNADHYHVFRGTTPFFTSDQVHATTSDPFYEDPNSLGNPDVNYFYYITAENTIGESDVSNRVGEFDYRLVTTPTTDFNEIALPFVVSNVTKASELMAIVPNCNSVAYWDAQSQGFDQYVDWLPPSDFPVQAGYPYYINVSQNGTFSIVGEYANPSFNLITTSTTDFNEIMLPLTKSHIQSAAQLLADIPNCNSVAYWNAATQGYDQYVDWLPPSNFEVRVGYPYYVNISADATWPGDVTFLLKQRDAMTVAANRTGSQRTVPHLIYGKFPVTEVDELSTLTLRAYPMGKSDDVLTERHTGCGLDGSGYFWIQCANFEGKWSVGEKIIVEINRKLSSEMMMRYEAILDETVATEANLIYRRTDPVHGVQRQVLDCYPNPYNAQTTVHFNLPEPAHVVIKIFNQIGQCITTLTDQHFDAGSHQLIWDSRNLEHDLVSSGIYYVVLESGDRHVVKKTILLK
ncbi:FG-GAP repeat protein [candidate division KSB1 bacterium]|nr:FG-GAP repeat protein [candidate division KSB1 bacterium]